MSIARLSDRQCQSDNQCSRLRPSTGCSASTRSRYAHLLICFLVGVSHCAETTSADDAPSLAQLTAAVEQLLSRAIVPDITLGDGERTHVSSAAAPLVHAAVDALKAGDSQTAERKAIDAQTTIPAITAYDAYAIGVILAVSHCQQRSISTDCADGLTSTAASPYLDAATRLRYLRFSTVIYHALHKYKASYTIGERAITLGATDYSTFAARADSFYVQRLYEDAGQTMEKWLELQHNCVPSSNTIFFAHHYYELAEDTASAARIYSKWPPVQLKGTCEQR